MKLKNIPGGEYIIFAALSLLFLLLGIFISGSSPLAMFFCLLSFLISGFSTISAAGKNAIWRKNVDERLIVSGCCAAAFLSGHYIDGAVSMLVFQLLYPLRNDLAMYAVKNDFLPAEREIKAVRLGRLLLIPAAAVVDLLLIFAFKLPAGETAYRTAGILVPLFPTVILMFITAVRQNFKDKIKFSGFLSLLTVMSMIKIITAVLMGMGIINAWAVILIDYSASAAAEGAVILLMQSAHLYCKKTGNDI